MARTMTRPGRAPAMAPRQRRRRRPRATLLLLVVASITLVTLDYRGNMRGTIDGARRVAHDAFDPVQGAVRDVLRPVGSFVGGALHYGAVTEQNAKLRTELRRLQNEQLAQADLRRRLAALAALEHLPWASVDSIPTVAATVVAGASSDFAATITLDVGTAQGVASGMPVVSGDGLVGSVVLASSHHCTVRLITDIRSQVGVRYGPAGSEALVAGKGAGRALEVDDVPPGTALARGEPLVTSGLQNALYPGGIPVATVVSSSVTASATQQQVTARPAADLARLQYVDVLLWEPGS